MAWVDKRKDQFGQIRYRVRAKINGKIETVIKDAGRWKDTAERLAKTWEDQHAGGSQMGQKARLPIEQMCDLNLQHHGRALKGGKSDHYRSAYYGYRLRMEQVKRAWAGKFADEINEYTVKGFLWKFPSVGTRMRWLGVLGKMFKNFSQWNDKGVLPLRYELPPQNPAQVCRAEMKPSEKKEYPDKRVLSKEEWNDFKLHLTVRARQICEIALQRFLRLADIRKLTNESQTEGAFDKRRYIQGSQQKTGQPFLVPIVAGHPVTYDFTNFRRDFHRAQILAGMEWPPHHQMHFSPKDLRRTGAVWAYRESRDIVTISKLLGHSRLSTTEQYLNVVDLMDVYKITKILDTMATDERVPREKRA